MSLEVPKKVVEYLQQYPEKRFTALDIAKWIFKTYPDECRQKKERSKVLKTDEEVIDQIRKEIGSKRPSIQKNNSNITITEGRPRNYYFSERKDDEVNVVGEAQTSKTETPALKEYDLYPKLSEFLWLELGLYSKRIDEKRSSNKQGAGGNEWLHPDLVGMEDLSEDWDGQIKDCVNVSADKRTKLWSFEVKKQIDRSNVRKSFFQAVSNSSWANFGYLVAEEIQDNALKELRMLASLHGIGFILLNVDDPSESEIMIPAKERGDVNWDMANRLAKENKGFMKYIKAIRRFYQTGDTHKADWDYKEGEEL